MENSGSGVAKGDGSADDRRSMIEPKKVEPVEPILPPKPVEEVKVESVEFVQKEIVDSSKWEADERFQALKEKGLPLESAVCLMELISDGETFFARNLTVFCSWCNLLFLFFCFSVHF